MPVSRATMRVRASRVPGIASASSWSPGSWSRDTETTTARHRTHGYGIGPARGGLLGPPLAELRYGVGSGYVPPKMSELPKVAGQSCSGAGVGTEPPVSSDIRYASIFGQSGANRVSFQTAAP